MKFEKVTMFEKNEETIEENQQEVEVYDYLHPNEAIHEKNLFFALSVVIFLLSLVSYILDQVFSSGKSLNPYGFSLMSIPFVMLGVFLPTELFKDKDAAGNYPLRLVSSLKKNGGSFLLYFSFIGVFLLFLLRVIFAYQVQVGNIETPMPFIEWIQVGIYGSSFFLLLLIVARYYQLNKRDFKKVRKPVKESSFIYRDLIKELSPFSYIFLVLLFVMMFFITILIP